MRNIKQLLAVGLVAAAVAGSPAVAGAQGMPRFELWAPSPDLRADVLMHIQHGDKLITERKYTAARREYGLAADLIRGDGEFPTDALRRIAVSYYFEGKYQNAVSALDELAREAARSGDLATQAWALADAAWVLAADCRRRHLSGAKMVLRQRVEALRELLRSPYLPDGIRDEIVTKRCKVCAADAPEDAKFTCYAPGPGTR